MSTTVKKSPTFPPSKIKKIIQQNQEVGKLSNVVPFLVERSLELFLIDIIEKVNEIADTNELSKVNPSILKKAIEDMPKYEFMKFAVEDLEEFQCLKKKKSEIKAEKIQKKKPSKTEIQPAPTQTISPLTTSTKRGRKKLTKQSEKNNQDVEELQEQMDE